MIPLGDLAAALRAMSPPRMLVALALILLLAAVMRRAAKAAALPGVLGEVVAGLILGPSLLGHAALQSAGLLRVAGCGPTSPGGAGPTLSSCLFPTDVQSVLSTLGFGGLVVFMFMMGLELDWEALKGRSRVVMTVTAGTVLMPVAGALLLGRVLYDSGFVAGWGTPGQPSVAAFTLLLAALLTVPGGPVVLRILQERGQLATPLGTLTGELVAVLTVIGFTLLGIAESVAKAASPGRILAVLGLTLLFVGALVGPGRVALRPLGTRVVGGDGLSLPWLLVTFVLLFATTAVGGLVGVSALASSHVFGAVFPRTALLKRLPTLEKGVSKVLLPIFLAMAGLRTDLAALDRSTLLAAGLLLLVAVAVKGVGGVLGARAGGVGLRESLPIAVLMNCRGIMIIVVASAGVQAVLITPAAQASAVVVALVTTSMTVPLLRGLARGPRSAQTLPGRVAVPVQRAETSPAESAPAGSSSAEETVG